MRCQQGALKGSNIFLGIQKAGIGLCTYQRKPEKALTVHSLSTSHSHEVKEEKSACQSTESMTPPEPRNKDTE